MRASWLGTVLLLGVCNGISLYSASAVAHGAEDIPVAACYKNEDMVGTPPRTLISPIDSKSIDLPHNIASKLSYYSPEGDRMLLAPRGWRCDIDSGGSGRDGVTIHPDEGNENEYIHLENVHLWGATGTLQTELVWEKRLGFNKALSRELRRIAGFLEEDELSYTRGAVGITQPYPKQFLKYRGRRIVEYETPPHAEQITPHEVQFGGSRSRVPYRVYGFVDACYQDGMSVFEVKLPSFPPEIAKAIVDQAIVAALPQNLPCEGNRSVN